MVLVLCLRRGCAIVVDETEREARIRALFPLVKKIARRIRRLVSSVDFDDLVGDGSIGLIRAVDNYDDKRGPSLEQYARGVIAGAMLNGIRRMDPVSERARRAVREGETERYRLAVERGTVPTIAEIDAVYPGFARASIVAHRTQPLSLDAPLPDGESLVADWTADPAVLVAQGVERSRLHKAIARLPERQRRLIREHYFTDKSLREIGRRMAISPQRASQLHLAAVARIKKALHAATH